MATTINPVKQTKNSLDTVTTSPIATIAKTPATNTIVNNTIPATAPKATTGYIVGAGYTPDTSLYAEKKDKNAVAAQMYDKQLEAYQRALQAAYENQAIANRAEAGKLKGEYDAARSDVYTQNRLSAIGNNERLAAKGLAGNLYDYARSGTSETSRIGQDIAMRKSIAGLNQSEAESRGDLALALLAAQKEADANYANKVAEVEAAKIPYITALARSASSGGGGGGGYYYPDSGSSSNGNSTDGKKTYTAEQIYNEAHAAAKYDSSDARNVMNNASNISALKNLGVDQKTIDAAIKLADQKYWANEMAKAAAKEKGVKTSTNKNSSRYMG